MTTSPFWIEDTYLEVRLKEDNVMYYGRELAALLLTTLGIVAIRMSREFAVQQQTLAIHDLEVLIQSETVRLHPQRKSTTVSP